MLLLQPDPTSGKQNSDAKEGAESSSDGRCSSLPRYSFHLQLRSGLSTAPSGEAVPAVPRRTLSLRQFRGTLIKAIKDSKETARRAEARGDVVPTSCTSTDQGLAELQGAHFIPHSATAKKTFQYHDCSSLWEQGVPVCAWGLPLCPMLRGHRQLAPRHQHPPLGPHGHLLHNLIAGVGTLMAFEQPSVVLKTLIIC